MSLNHIEKERISLNSWLKGKEFWKELKIMNYAEEHHSGVRKDGVTPEFYHQIWIASTIRTFGLPDDMLRRCIALAFLHDTPEDNDIGFEELDHKFGPEIASDAKLLTKKHRGYVLPKETYFLGLISTPQSAIVKGVDRWHNLSTMLGVFSMEKMQRYIDETEEYHLPMLKTARKLYPEYEATFELIKRAIKLQITTIKYIIQREQSWQ